MDLTKLPKSFIYQDKTSLDDYDIENESSADGLLYEVISKLSIRIPANSNREELFLAIFNDAYLLTTVVIIDNRFSLHTHSWINYFLNKWNDPHAVSVIIEMVVYYSRFIDNRPTHVDSAVDMLYKDYTEDDIFKNYSGSAVFKYVNKPANNLPCGRFLLDRSYYLITHAFHGKVNWRAVTNKFEINDIIRIAKILGRDLRDQSFILRDISCDLETPENGDVYSRELFKMLGILIEHLEKDGVLLSKKRLYEEFDMWMKQDEEYHRMSFEQQMEEFAKSQIKGHVQKYEQEISRQEDELKKLKEENKLLIQRLEEKESEIAFNGTGKECFTKAKMWLLIHTIASITDGPIPIKARFPQIISAIGGWEETSVNAETKKAGFNKSDIETVAKLFEDTMPNFAAEIRKQSPRPKKTKK